MAVVKESATSVWAKSQLEVSEGLISLVRLATNALRNAPDGAWDTYPGSLDRAIECCENAVDDILRVTDVLGCIIHREKEDTEVNS